jgi:carotenoid cleavage dioxygenase-like enzyme
MNANFDPSPIAVELLPDFIEAWEGLSVFNLNTKLTEHFMTDVFYHTHVANTYENETGIVMDVNVFKDLPFSPHEIQTDLFANKTFRDNKSNNKTNTLERMHLHLAGPMKGQVTRQVLSPPGRYTDFMRINDMKSGMPYCIYYAVEWFHDDVTYTSMAVLKHDICQDKRTYWTKVHHYPHEPVFVPLGTADDAEDHGLIVFVALNGPRGADDFVVLNATTLEEVSVVELGAHSAFLAHGQFVPKAAQKAARTAMAVEHPELAAAIETTFVV